MNLIWGGSRWTTADQIMPGESSAKRGTKRKELNGETWDQPPDSPSLYQKETEESLQNKKCSERKTLQGSWGVGTKNNEMRKTQGKGTSSFPRTLETKSHCPMGRMGMREKKVPFNRTGSYETHEGGSKKEAFSQGTTRWSHWGGGGKLRSKLALNKARFHGFGERRFGNAKRPNKRNHKDESEEGTWGTSPL